MPKTKLTARLRRRPLPPRRISDEEARETYRKDVLGLPGPIDVWLTTNTAGTAKEEDAHRPLSADEIQCYVQVQCIAAQDDDGDGFFADPDRHVLYLTVDTVGNGQESHETRNRNVYPRIVLESYEGWNSSPDAPDWTQWASGRTVTFRYSKIGLAELLVRVASKKNNLNSLIKGLESMRL